MDPKIVEAAKEVAAKGGIDYLASSFKTPITLGVGTGSTTEYLIRKLKTIRPKIGEVVASSKRTEAALRAEGFSPLSLSEVTEIDCYIDGADEVNEFGEMIKGGGGALTGEKVLASMAKEFICIADESKLVHRLGAFPLPVEVVPFARSFVARRLVSLGGNPEYRENFLTDYGNQILRVEDLNLDIPVDPERLITAIPGVVTCGIFAEVTADRILLGTSVGLKVYECLSRHRY